MARLVLLQGSPDEPEHRWPETDEERATLRVTALALVDGASPDPQTDAQEYVGDTQDLEVILT